MLFEKKYCRLQCRNLLLIYLQILDRLRQLYSRWLQSHVAESISTPTEVPSAERADRRCKKVGGAAVDQLLPQSEDQQAPWYAQKATFHLHDVLHGEEGQSFQGVPQSWDGKIKLILNSWAWYKIYILFCRPNSPPSLQPCTRTCLINRSRNTLTKPKSSGRNSMIRWLNSSRCFKLTTQMVNNYIVTF